jgi:putative DNA primase/helicase
MVAEVRPYKVAALKWFDQGWSPLPLPRNAKFPPPDGYTGYKELEPTRAKIKEWIAENPAGNIAIRLPDSVIGIDIDAYAAKHGDEALARLEAEYGELPPTIRTTSRGFKNPSGIRWYRIREGVKFPGVLAPGIEVIQWHHRYAVVWPSTNPKAGGAQYQSFDDRNDDGVNIEVFSPEDLTEFPLSWYDVQAERGAGLDKAASLEAREVTEWLADEANAAHLCRAMRNVAAKEESALAQAVSSGESRYDTARDGVMALVRLAQEGHRGVAKALAKLHDAYDAAVADEADRDPGEYARMVSGAIAAVIDHMEDAHEPNKCPDREQAKIDIDPGLWPSPKDPLDVAQRLVEERWSDNKRPTLCYWRGDFYRWVGPHWSAMSEDRLKAELYRTLGEVAYMSAAAQPIELRWSPNKSKIAHVIEALQGVCLSEAEDGSPDLIHFANGALRLYDDGSRELLEHSPERFNLASLPYDYDPHAPTPKRWLAFLSSLFGDDAESIELLQEWFGYVLSGDTEQQKMMLLVGPPRAGKGLIARILTALLGHCNVAGPTLSQLAQNFGMQSLIGKSLGVIGDARFQGQTATVVERLLSITGEDTITIDRKNRDPWTGRVSARLMVLSNELPSLAEASGALASRFVGPLVLHRSFLGREDLALERKLTAELPGILLWSLAGLDRLYETGWFTTPESSRAAIRDLQELSSPERAFMRECCTREAEAVTAMPDLYRAFQRWSEHRGRRNVPMFEIFSRNLKAAYPDLEFRRTTKGFARQTQVVERVKLRENLADGELFR